MLYNGNFQKLAVEFVFNHYVYCAGTCDRFDCNSYGKAPEDEIRFKLIVFLYSCTLALTMTASMMTAYITEFKLSAWIVMSVGALLFLLSDLVLSGMYFGENKNTKGNIILNHTLYYAAQFCMAATILFIK